VKNHEQTRIDDALKLVATSSAPLGSKRIDRQESYQVFLKKVEKLCGLEIVALCAVGLGKIAIAAMRERVRLELPFSIKLEENTLKCSALRKFTQERPAKDQMASTMVESRGTPTESEIPSEPEASPEPETSYLAEAQALELNLAAMPPMQQIGERLH
jgi:hypothetical protein